MSQTERQSHPTLSTRFSATILSVAVVWRNTVNERMSVGFSRVISSVSSHIGVLKHLEGVESAAVYNTIVRY